MKPLFLSMAGYAPSVCNLISCVKQIMEYNNRVIVFVYGRCLSHGFMLLLFVVITDVVLVRTIVSSLKYMYCCLGYVFIQHDHGSCGCVCTSNQSILWSCIHVIWTAIGLVCCKLGSDYRMFRL